MDKISHNDILRDGYRELSPNELIDRLEHEKNDRTALEHLLAETQNSTNLSKTEKELKTPRIITSINAINERINVLEELINEHRNK